MFATIGRYRDPHLWNRRILAVVLGFTFAWSALWLYVWARLAWWLWDGFLRLLYLVLSWLLALIHVPVPTFLELPEIEEIEVYEVEVHVDDTGLGSEEIEVAEEAPPEPAPTLGERVLTLLGLESPEPVALPPRPAPVSEEWVEYVALDPELDASDLAEAEALYERLQEEARLASARDEVQVLMLGILGGEASFDELMWTGADAEVGGLIGIQSSELSTIEGGLGMRGVGAGGGGTAEGLGGLGLLGRGSGGTRLEDKGSGRGLGGLGEEPRGVVGFGDSGADEEPVNRVVLRWRDTEARAASHEAECTREVEPVFPEAWRRQLTESARCDLLVHVGTDGQVARVQFEACPAAARGPVHEAVLSSEWAPARDDGVAVYSSVRVSYDIEPLHP